MVRHPLTPWRKQWLAGFAWLGAVLFLQAAPAAGDTLIHWYGHAFIYLTSSTGIRVAFDPFGPETVQYPFPQKLQADFVLISNETEPHAAGERLSGTAQVFRSITAVGMNRANGLFFRGVATARAGDAEENARNNTVFVCDIDGLRFAHLGRLGRPLDARQRQDLGRVDVLFLPVGEKVLSIEELTRMAEQLGARAIIPISYKTARSGPLDLRPLQEFTAHFPFVEEMPSNEMTVSARSLPEKPTVFILKEP